MPTPTEPTAADIAYKAMADARSKLRAAGVDYYLVVGWNGLIAEDAAVTPVNAPSIEQRLDAISAKLHREHPATPAPHTPTGGR